MLLLGFLLGLLGLLPLGGLCSLGVDLLLDGSLLGTLGHVRLFVGLWVWLGGKVERRRRRAGKEKGTLLTHAVCAEGKKKKVKKAAWLKQKKCCQLQPECCRPRKY